MWSAATVLDLQSAGQRCKEDMHEYSGDHRVLLDSFFFLKKIKCALVITKEA